MKISLLAIDLGVSPQYILSLFPRWHSSTDLTNDEASYVIHKTIEDKQHLPPNFDFDKYLAGEITLFGETLDNNKNNHTQVSNNVVSDTNNSLQKAANVILNIVLSVPTNLLKKLPLLFLIFHRALNILFLSFQ